MHNPMVTNNDMLWAVWPVIYREMELRRENRSVLLDHMQDVMHRYNGEWAVPYPGSDAGPDLPPLGPAIVTDAIDHTGMMAGSVSPNIFCPSMNPGEKKADMNARKRKQSLDYVWYMSGGKLLWRKWYRQLAGYSTFAMNLVCDWEHEVPRIQVLDPLGVYPEEVTNGTMTPPKSAGIVHVLHKDAVLRMFPFASSQMRDSYGRKGVIDPEGPQMWELVEWVDEQQRVWGILGPRDTPIYRAHREIGRETHMPLHWSPNPLGMCTVLMPERVSLDKTVSQVAHILSMTDLQSRLMALDILSSERSIFPDRVIVGSSTNPPTLVGGRWHDGIDGEPNIILNAEQVFTLGNSPDPNVKIGMDRLERNAKTSAGLLPQMMGETPGGGLRTGRANEAIFSSAAEPRIQEYHEIGEFWATKMNERVIEAYNVYWPSKKYVVFTGNRGHSEIARFSPKTHLDSRWNATQYSVPGASSSRLTVELSQMLAIEAISMDDYRMAHPHIPDAETTKKKVDQEALERSLRRFIEVGIENQTLSIEDQIVLGEQLEKGESLLASVKEMQRASQERQAALLAEQQEQMEGIQMGALPGANPMGADQVPGLQGLPVENANLPEAPSTFEPNANQRGLFNLIGATQKGMR